MQDKTDVFLIDILSQMREAGSWCGETHLQKSVYLLQELEQVDVSAFDFLMYKHGPYSFDLHDTIGEMEASMLIERIATPPYGSRLEITGSGRRLLEKHGGPNQETSPAVRAIARSFSTLTVSELERYATALYVNRELPSAPLESRVERFRELKRHIPEHLALESFQRIEDYRTEKADTDGGNQPAPG